MIGLAFCRHAEGLLAQQRTFGESGLALTKRLFCTWHAFHEHQDRDRLAREMAPIQTELRSLLEHAGRKSAYTRYHRRFAGNLLKLWPALWRSSRSRESSRPITPQNAHCADR